MATKVLQTRVNIRWCADCDGAVVSRQRMPRARRNAVRPPIVFTRRQYLSGRMARRVETSDGYREALCPRIRARSVRRVLAGIRRDQWTDRRRPHRRDQDDRRCAVGDVVTVPSPSPACGRRWPFRQKRSDEGAGRGDTLGVVSTVSFEALIRPSLTRRPPSPARGRRKRSADGLPKTQRGSKTSQKPRLAAGAGAVSATRAARRRGCTSATGFGFTRPAIGSTSLSCPSAEATACA